MLKLVIEENGTQCDESAAIGVTLDDLARAGARRMLMEALLVEVDEYIEANRGEKDALGHRLVVRNGFGKPRSITLGCGTLEVRAPRVNDKRVEPDGTRKRFSSCILPKYARRSPEVQDVLPVLYLRGLSSNDFKPALKALLGDKAQGLSASAITRLKQIWEKDYKKFRSQRLDETEYAYIWVDGVHFKIRLEDDRLCALVVIGVRADGTKELLAIEDGYRESAESWKDVIRDLSDRGMKAPLLAIGDGALGFWAAVRDVWPKTKEQRCWVHKIANVLDKLPKRLQPKAKEALHEIMNAPSRETAEEDIEKFARKYQAKYPKAVKSLTKGQDKLMTYFDFPAEHWRHIRTTNPIESTFATVKLRTRVTKGAGSRRAALTMAFKLMDAAAQRWRQVNGRALVQDVLNGVKFEDGVRVKITTERDAA